MRCSDVEALWDEIREGLQGRDEPIFAHVASCAMCREAFRECDSVAKHLQDLAASEPPKDLLQRVLSHIKTLHAGETLIIESVTRMSSPIGTLIVAFNDRGISYLCVDRRRELEDTRREIEARLRRKTQEIQELPTWVRAIIDDFFSGTEPAYDRVDISSLSEFEQAALKQVAQIPRGEVRSYGWVAKEIGRPQAARAVGRAMARNPVALLYPCHRVVDAAGSLHDYAFGLETKALLLEMEGYVVTNVKTAE